jgi:hypothetical protein
MALDNIGWELKNWLLNGDSTRMEIGCNEIIKPQLKAVGKISSRLAILLCTIIHSKLEGRGGHHFVVLWIAFQIIHPSGLPVYRAMELRANFLGDVRNSRVRTACNCISVYPFSPLAVRWNAVVEFVLKPRNAWGE